MNPDYINIDYINKNLVNHYYDLDQVQYEKHSIKSNKHFPDCINTHATPNGTWLYKSDFSAQHAQR